MCQWMAEERDVCKIQLARYPMKTGMPSTMKVVMCFMLFSCIVSISAQTTELDSLIRYTKSCGQNTSYADALNIMAEVYDEGQHWHLSDSCSTLSMAISKKLNYKNGIGEAYKQKGFVCEDTANLLGATLNYKLAIPYFIEAKNSRGHIRCLGYLAKICLGKGSLNEAITYFKRTIEVSKLAKADAETAYHYSGLGDVYYCKGNYNEALRNNLLSLQYSVQAGDKESEASACTSLGNIYSSKGDFENGILYYSRALKINLERSNFEGVAACYSNFGAIFHSKGMPALAEQNYQQGIQVLKSKSDTLSEDFPSMLGNLADVYIEKSNFREAELLLKRSLFICEKIGDASRKASSSMRLGSLYAKMNRPQDAKAWYEKGIRLANEIGGKEVLKESYDQLSRLDVQMGNYEHAYTNYRKYVMYRDSLDNLEAEKNAARLQLQYEYDKRKSADSIKVQGERTLNLVRSQEEKKQRYWLYAGLVLVIVFSGFMVNRYQVTMRQKKLIELKEQETMFQKHLVEEKNQEITDSITYAKRLQEAILPPADYLDIHYPENFVLYLPKDIVAGDFYWAEQVADQFLIAAADSTGHGVPGAMVSVVCSNALNRAVFEFGLSDPGLVLDKTRELVLSTFSKGNAEVKDGMDISLLSIDTRTKKICWSGANNPLFYLDDGEVKEIKADKQPIGKTEHPKPFTTHSINPKPGSMFYLITDGFADQFGGDRGKKFMYKRLLQLFVDHHSSPMDIQKEEFKAAFDSWKGNLEQVDDVTIIGIRL